jgi:hypothetical protein
MTSDPLSSDFSYRKYSLEQLDNWVHDALNCEDLTPQDIYDTIVKCVDGSVEYHKKYLTKSVELLSPECQRSWNDFWEENYYPEEYYPHPNQKQYTEEELSAMCEQAASEAEKQKCREYNLREAEYYDKRAKLDAEYTHAKIQANSPYNDGFTQEYYQKLADEIKAAGGYDWTPGN